MKTAALAFLICSTPFIAQCDDLIIAPASAAGHEGNSYAIPLDTGPFAARFQQIYSSSVFADYSAPLRINGIAFRGDAIIGHGFITTVSNIEIHLSTTSKPVDGLSASFDANVGLDDKIVVGRPPALLRGFGGGGIFDAWSIVFDTSSNPFLYNPAGGNLLLDIKVFSGSSTEAFDAVDQTGDSVSSVFAYANQIPGSGQSSSLGLSTIFQVQPIPEPSTVTMFLLGLVGLGVGARIQAKRRDN